MQSKLETVVNNEIALKLKRRAAKVGMNPSQAMAYIARNGVKSFLALLIAPIKGSVAV